jgi:hypothetical protein
VRRKGGLVVLSGWVIGLVTAVSSAAADDVASILLSGTGKGVVKFETVTDLPSRSSCSSSCVFPYPPSRG